MGNRTYNSSMGCFGTKTIKIQKGRQCAVSKIEKTLPEMGNVMLYNLIGEKQTLKLNSVKLIGSIIMQAMRDIEELNQPYIISIKELPELLGVSASNVCQEVEEITDDIIKNPLYVKKENVGKSIRWIKIPWVSKCEYDSDIGVVIKLNKELRPFLINIKDYYTQYTLQEMLATKSALCHQNSLGL